MSLFNSQKAVILNQNEGRRLWIWGDLYTLKITGAETNGTYALVECEVAPGSGTPPHIHHAEDEMFYFLSGEMTFWADGQQSRASAGSYVYIPRGMVHAWKNESSAPVKLLSAVTPAGFEQFFVAIGEPVTEAMSTPPAVTPEMIETAIKLAPTYHMEVVAVAEPRGL